MLSSRSKSLLQGFIFSIIVSIVLVTLVPISSIFPQNSCQVEDNSYDSFLHYNQTFSDNLFSSSNLSSFTNDSLQLTLHDPIVITSNDDFLTYDFPGNGTEFDPYRIENLNITTEVYNGISIRDVGSFFVIQNCIIDAHVYGIQINSVSSREILIYNNICYGNFIGIGVSTCTNLSIENNICSYNSEAGIAVGSSSAISIRNNTCFLNEIGTSIGSSESCLFTDNLIHNNLIGFTFNHNKLLTIRNNQFYKDGIFFPFDKDGEEYDYSLFVIENNTVNDLPFGFFSELTDEIISQEYGQCVFYRCNNIEINTILISQTHNGLTLIECSKFEFHNISVFNSYNGILLLDCLDIEVYNSTFYYNSVGLYFHNSSNCYIHQNTFVNNLGYGILMNHWSNNNIIVLNSFISNALTHYGPQARDDADTNQWYDKNSKQGNFWSDLSPEMCNYEIDGYADSKDLYPLNRLESCPDFFIRKKMKISLYSILIPSFFVLLIKYLHKPSRRQPLERSKI